MNISKKSLILGLIGIILLVFSGIQFSKMLPVLHNKIRIDKIVNSQEELDYKGYAKALSNYEDMIKDDYIKIPQEENKK